ncbi:Rieske (2Fe-2S) protein [Natrarchaeobius sp. A-rgal3]|uniref:Rieske (2Fe-2S) protein n=1 Tax=Natrarchaeobius versutus TaxID=1679078 RepID=UPI00350FFFE5
MIDVGSVELLAQTPRIVTLEGNRYVLHEREDGDVTLYSAVCPHQRGRVMAREGTLLCPNHRWEFDPETGECLTVADERLRESSVTREDGSLVVDELPDETA